MNTQIRAASENPAPLTGAALLKNRISQGLITRREAELIAALQDAALELTIAGKAAAAKSVRATIAKFTKAA